MSKFSRAAQRVLSLSNAIPMTTKPHTEWFHGSSKRLVELHSGSTVTLVFILARAFSHKPEFLSIEVSENDDTGKRSFDITHDGTKHGFLYRVIVTDPENDLILNPASKGAQGEEMLTTRIGLFEATEMGKRH